jgi:hypothetical protein
MPKDLRFADFKNGEDKQIVIKFAGKVARAMSNIGSLILTSILAGCLAFGGICLVLLCIHLFFPTKLNRNI